MRPRRFVPGSFQRHGVDIDEEIEGQLDYLQMWQTRNKEAKEKLAELETGEHETTEEEWDDKIAEQEERVSRTSAMLAQSMDELKKLESLKRKIKTQPERLPMMLTMININFAETYAKDVCSSSYADVVFDIEFPEGADPNSMEHSYNKGTFPCEKGDKPIFLKLEEPGHMLCALIFPATKVCEIWNTHTVPKNVRKYFVALLPHYYTIICINAQLQVKWCAKGAENVYVVEQKGSKKPLINIYCQAWPYFFAYMRCVKGFSHLDILKFLSCLTDEQKTVLIDAFNTALANRGRDIRYISEINDVKHFQSYVRSCNPLLNLQKSIKYVSASDYPDDYRKMQRSLNREPFARALRSVLGQK